MKNNELTLVNFRDLGGLETACGRKIKSGKLYRTSVFDPKTDADIEFVKNMKLDSVIDLRTEAEIAEKPDVLPDGVEYVKVSVFQKPEHNALAPSKGLMLSLMRADEEQITRFKELILDSYRYMPYSDAYGEIFSRMDQGRTVAFHCTAGKDRTGVGAMLIELALGRNPEDVKAQYMLSNDCRAALNEKLFRKYRFVPMKKYLADFCVYAATVHEELFDEAYKAVFDKFGDITEFLGKVYGITPHQIEKWKEFYTE